MAAETLEGQIGELRGEVNGLKSRMDDIHRLLIALISVTGAGLLASVIGVILQLAK